MGLGCWVQVLLGFLTPDSTPNHEKGESAPNPKPWPGGIESIGHQAPRRVVAKERPEAFPK